jgi:hypothetical protein
MIIIAVNVTLHNNIFHSNSYIILICVMCLWPGLVVDTRYMDNGSGISCLNFTLLHEWCVLNRLSNAKFDLKNSYTNNYNNSYWCIKAQKVHLFRPSLGFLVEVQPKLERARAKGTFWLRCTQRFSYLFRQTFCKT